MEKIDYVLCDTDVLIEFYRWIKEIVSELRKIGQNNIAISIVTIGELIFGALNKRELKQINNDISNLAQFDLDSKTSKIFVSLLNKYSLSHNLAIPDALIAATAISNEIPLFTLNKKDFRYIEILKLYV